MTSSELIGRETMISRLIYFNTKRIDRVFINHTQEFREDKKAMFSYTEYSKLSTRKICKEYDTTFGDSGFVSNSADFQQGIN